MSAIQLTTSNPRRKSSRSWTLIGAVGALAVLSLIRSQCSSPVDIHSHKDTSESLQQPVLRPFGAFASSIASLHRGSSHKTFAHQVATQATQSCEVCVATPDDPLCEYGLDNIRLSRAYEGSGTRVRRVLQRAIRGEEIRIGVLGASVTAGHNLRGAQSWVGRFFEDFQRMFPTAKLIDGSAPAMDSAFYSYCYKSLVPDDMDLYLVELDINNNAYPSTLDADDDLLRALMDLPQRPAVVRVAVPALAFTDMTRGSMSSLLLSNYFDVPNIGIRNMVLPHLLAHEEDIKHYFSQDQLGGIDTRHISALSHRMIGDMMTLYFREQVCEVKRRRAHPPPEPASGSLWPKGDQLGELPRLKVHKPYEKDKTVPPIVPTCHILTANDESKALKPVGPLGWQDNWKKEEWNGKAAWQSANVGSRITFEFTGTKIGVFLWSSNGAGYKIKPGRAACWVNDEVEKKIIADGLFNEPAARPMFHVVAEGLPYKRQTVTCELIAETSTGDHDLRIVGVASA